MKRAMAAAVVVTLLAAAPAARAAEVRIGLNGARPSELPVVSDLLGDAGFTQQRWLRFASQVGRNWLPDMEAVPVDYPAQMGPFWGPGALSGDESIAVGQQNLHAAILAEVAEGNTVSVASLSMGTLVVDRELAYLAQDPDAPPADAVTFYVFGGESRGFGEMYARGVTVPWLGVTFHPVPESQYDVVVVAAEWDGWAIPPDRPWHVLSVVNAVMGALYTVDGTNDHSAASIAARSDAVLVSEVVNARGGTTSMYMIPAANLPLTRPLRELGVDDDVVDGLDRALMPAIEAGYSSRTPDLGPHIERGTLVETSSGEPVDSESDSSATDSIDSERSEAESETDKPRRSPKDDESARTPRTDTRTATDADSRSSSARPDTEPGSRRTPATSR